MVIYNVTVNVDDEIADQWVQYMKVEHIPDVLNTGCFTGYVFTKVLTRQKDETGQTFSIQYHCTDMAAYESYRDQFAAGMQRDVAEKYNGRFSAFRTLLEEVE